MSLKKNVVANFLGQGWVAIMGIAFVPTYIKYLGIEAYALIGVFAIMQTCLSLLDMGITPTLNREMARFTSGTHTAQSIRSLLKSLEIICFLVALFCGLLIWSASDWLASEWLHASKLSIGAVKQAIEIMGFVAALRFVESIYRGSILGLQKQVFFNLVNSSFATLRAIGAILVLIYISPRIEVYFAWQGLVSIISLTTLAYFTHKTLPKAPLPAKFSIKALMDIRHFAGGMMAATLLALLLTQLDKILLSRFLTLDKFGYYTLAATVASVIVMLVSPITQAFYPRFTELVVKKDNVKLISAYHLSAQLVTILATPPALILIFFSNNILLLWTGNSVLSHQVTPLLTILALGTLLNGLMHIPSMLALAHGWSAFAFWVNLVAIFLLLPAILWTTPHYGPLGAAWSLLLLNIGYVFVGIHFMHSRILPLEKWRWYCKDILLPILAGTLVAGFFRLTEPVAMVKTEEFLWLIVVGFSIFATTAISANEVRLLTANKVLKHIRTYG